MRRRNPALTAKKVQVYVETGPYVSSHGKEPRGYGSWAWQPMSNRQPMLPGDRHQRYFFTPPGTYGDSKRLAVLRAKDIGAAAGVPVVILYVLP